MTPDPDALLAKQPGRQRTFKLPDLLSDRLDNLCKTVTKDGTHGTIQRQDLLAALVATSVEDLGDLDKLIDRYWNMKVREALIGDEKGAKIIELYPVKPGRRAG